MSAAASGSAVFPRNSSRASMTTRLHPRSAEAERYRRRNKTPSAAGNAFRPLYHKTLSSAPGDEKLARGLRYGQSMSRRLSLQQLWRPPNGVFYANEPLIRVDG